MNNPFRRFLIISFFVLNLRQGITQPLHYSTENAHSHNDYEQAHPFRTAYNADIRIH